MNKMDFVSTSKIIGTPSYIFDEQLFEKRAEKVKNAFGKNVGMCFSIKANPFLLCALPKVFDAIEVCSPGELTICEKMGVDMKKVIYSGVNKGADDVNRALCDGVGEITAESILHLKLINAAAKCLNTRPRVLLRLSAGSQFGVDEDTFFDVISNRGDYENLDIIGVHYFSGTQKKKSATLIKELNYLSDFVDRLSVEHAFVTERLEYGTGLAVDYFAENADEAEESRLHEISDAIKKLGEKAALTVEMGRFFAAPCGFYLTTVVDIKTNFGINYAILDGGLNQLKYDGQIQGMQIPKILHIGEKTGDIREWTLCGSLCTTADVLARKVPLDNLKIGDLLVFCRTGAYSVSEGMALFLSRELPAVSILCKNGDLKILRSKMSADTFNTANI